MTRFRIGPVRSSSRSPQRALFSRLVTSIAIGTAFPFSPLSAQTATELQVTPETMTLGVGQRQTIFVAAYDQQGNLVSSAKFTFRSSDTLIAKVGPDGNVLGVSPGLAKVEARLQGRRASLAVLVTGSEREDGPGRNPAPPGSVLTLDPGSLVLLPGETVAITPQGLKEDGSPAATGKVAWKSLKPEVASVDSNGVVVAIAAGKTIIQAATSTGLMATAPVDVIPAEITLSDGRIVLAPEEVDTLRVLAPSQGNREVHGTVRWTSADSAVATIDSAGIVTARRPGQTEIVAAGFGQKRRALVLVHQLPQSLVVAPRQTPDPVLVPFQGTRKFTATAEAADSTPIPEARIIWEIGDTNVIVRDSAKSAITARGPGTSTLTARLGGFEPVVWTIKVVPGVLALDRARVGLTPDERVSLEAQLLDDQGKPVAPTGSLEWVSEKASVATVSANGEVVAVGPGKTAVTASAPWGGKASTEVFVVSDLLVASDRGGAPGIYQVRSNGAELFVPLLVDSAANLQAVLSPDRTRVALSSNRGGSYDLWVMDADGHDLRRLTTDPGTEGEPAWTPDGARIVYTAAPKTGSPQLASIRTDGTDNRVLTTSASGNRSAVVSPDGASIAFVSARDGSSKIYTMAPDGSTQRRVTKGSDRESNPHYLPTGELIFVTEKGGGSRLQRLAVGAAQGVTIFETNQPVVALGVSKDGSRVAYTAGKLAESGKKSKLALIVQALVAQSTPGPVALRPGEQILSVSF